MPTPNVVSLCVFLCALCVSAVRSSYADEKWVTYEGKDGPGAGKHIVLISGDEEYRSEEALPQLGKILATQHGFKCTVLFALDDDGTINPNNSHNIPGLEALKDADLMVIATRFRDLPDEQMQHIDDYLKSGKPVIGMRTATHAFNIGGDKKFAHYGNGYGGDKKEWSDGFGRLVLGEKWISHHGGHKSEATGGLVAEGAKDHPITRGINDRDVWGDTDVYGVRLPLPGDSQPIILGAVLTGMKFDDPIKEGKQNDPMMPVAWTKTYELPEGAQGRVFTTTLGSASDLVAEGTRRMLVNGAYWCLGLEEKIPAEGTKVDIVGDYKPTMYGFGGFTKGVKPSDHKL